MNKITNKSHTTGTTKFNLFRHLATDDDTIVGIPSDLPRPSVKRGGLEGATRPGVSIQAMWEVAPACTGGGIPALRFAGESDKRSARVSITVGRLPQIIMVVIEVVSQRVA